MFDNAASNGKTWIPHGTENLALVEYAETAMVGERVNGGAIDHLIFDSEGLPADEAFARYHELYSAGTDAFRIGPDFHARVEGWRLDNFLLYDRRLSGVGHRRTEATVQATGFNHFTATLLLEGSIEIETPGGRFRVMECGEIILHDVRVPATNHIRNAHIVTCAISRARLEAMFVDVDRLDGIVLPPEHTRLIRDYIVSLLKTLPSLLGEAAPIVSSVLMSLLYAAIQSWDREHPRTPASRDDERIGHIIALIDRHLPDPSFGAAGLVSLSGFSRATLYRLVEPYGGLAAIIRSRRLDFVRARLGDAEERRSFADIAAAAGMKNTAAAAAVFAKHNRMTPEQYRLRAAGDGSGSGVHKLIVWQEEVARPRRRA